MISECLTPRHLFGHVSELAELLLSTALATLWTSLALTSSCLADGLRPQVLVINMKALKSPATTSKSGQQIRCHGKKVNIWDNLPPSDSATLRLPLDLTCLSSEVGSSRRLRTRSSYYVSALTALRPKPLQT